MEIIYTFSPMDFIGFYNKKNIRVCQVQLSDRLASETISGQVWLERPDDLIGSVIQICVLGF